MRYQGTFMTLAWGLAASMVCCEAAEGGSPACPQAGMVVDEIKITEGKGGFGGDLRFSEFGASLANIGDVDGDGIADLAVGAHFDDDGGFDSGAVWVLLLDGDGTVKGEQKISEVAGGFGGEVDNIDRFGSGVAGLGDLDGDGVPDLAVGVQADDDGGTNRGAVWVLFLNADGTVKAEQKISSTSGGLTGPLEDGDNFGIDVASVGDLDGDGTTDVAVGAWGDDDGGVNHGAVWVLFLNADGTVKAEQKISPTVGGFEGDLVDGDFFGSSTAAVGDLDGDGITELAVGAYVKNDGGPDRGAVWVLFLNNDGTVKAEQKISATAGGFGGQLDDGDLFGIGLGGLGDLDGDGAPDLAVGAANDDDGGPNHGAVWILFLNIDGTVKAEQKVSDTAGGFGGVLADFNGFGVSVAALGDLDGDEFPELAVGANQDNQTGAVWVLSLNDGGVSAACPADVVRDGVVDSSDLNAVLAEFGQASGAGCVPDINGDGAIDSIDLNAVLGAFGRSCPSSAVGGIATIAGRYPEAMSTLRPFGIAVLLIGLAVGGWAAVSTGSILMKLYSSTLEDPLNDELDEDAMARTLRERAFIAFGSAPVVAVGSGMLVVERRRRWATRGEQARRYAAPYDGSTDSLGGRDG